MTKTIVEVKEFSPTNGASKYKFLGFEFDIDEPLIKDPYRDDYTVKVSSA
jgi:hypothetical protein